jgi:hypothetical protein
MDRFSLQKLLVEQTLGRPLETMRPVRMTIDQATQALWPLNDRFRPHLAQIQSLAYDKALEAAADTAIEGLALRDADWAAEPPGVWRVLLERQMQVLQLCAVKAAEAGTWAAPFIPVPEPAPAPLRAKLAVVFLLHSTPLPFPVADRAGVELPQGNVPGNLTRH